MARLPNTAIVLQPTNSPIVTLDLCLQLGGTSGNVWRKSMAREEKEVASRTIERLRILIAQIDGEKGGKRTSREKLLESCQSIEVLGVLSKDGESLSERVGNVNTNEEELVELDTSVPNSIFWKNARRIIIGPTIVTVKYNVPTITAVTPPSSLYVGVPAVCGSIAALFTTEADVQYEWCSRGPCTSLSEKGVGSAAVRVISTSPVLIPTEKELGESLFLRVLPQPGSDLCTIVDLPTVQLEFPSMDRWKHTTKPATAPVFRVVTYNILHDEFCTSGSAKKTIYPFATDDILALEYRQARIVQELIAYKADIVCLQECGKKVYQRFLSRVMLHLGYEGCYSNKNGGVQEGCACFWRSSRFALEEKSEFPLNWSTLETDHPQLAADVSKHEEFKEALRNVTSIGVMLQLKDRITNEKLLVGNTHLFYHANACHIRLLQAFMLLSRLQQMAHSHTAVVLCGDFNFTHTTGGYRLVTTGCVESGHHSWTKGEVYHWGCDRLLGNNAEEGAGVKNVLEAPEPVKSSSGATPLDNKDNANEKEAMSSATPSGNNVEAPKKEPHPPFEAFRADIEASLQLTDSYGLTEPDMPWTNYTMSFREVIDYIFFDASRLSVTNTVPIPPESELSENVALPNRKYPSDHVALVADLTYR